MILSYHPCFEADTNRLCAGRQPGNSDRLLMRAASAVILPQGCSETLFAMAREHCPHVFPNYKARFAYPGKKGQIRLFKDTETPHPETRCFESVAAFKGQLRNETAAPGLAYPLVFKYDWGGEGHSVFLIRSAQELEGRLTEAAQLENSGQKGFLISAFIAPGNKTLRTVVIGSHMISYWRIQNHPDHFGTSLGHGARIDSNADPDLIQKGETVVVKLCARTGINLAGFDVIFDEQGRESKPLLLEINYFFGRRGLGGSPNFYRLLNLEIEKWLNQLDLAAGR
jgi:ribosomal protein S6--L-glutamate ligase